jgi:hypothetical protein
MTHLAHSTVLQQHLDNIKTHLDWRISQQMKVIQPGSRKSSAASGVDRGGRPCPVFGRPRLYLDEDQTILVAENQINLAAFGAKIGRQELQTFPFEVFLCHPLSKFSMAEV